MSSPDRNDASGNTNHTDQEHSAEEAQARPSGRLRHSLSGVSENLLVSLLARHLEATAAEPMVDDPWAGTLVRRLGLDVDRFGTMRKVRTATAIRTAIIDDLAGDYARGVDNPTIVTFGAGLCTRYFRIDAPGIHWVDIDLPNVAALRQELLPAHHNREVIASSVLDPRWGASLRDRRPASTLFIVEGLLMFLAPDEVSALLTRIADRYPGAELIAESVDPRALARGGRHPLVPTGAQLRWGTHDFAEIAQWHQRIELVDQWSFLARDPRLPQRTGLRHRLADIGPKVRLGHLRVTDGH